MSLKADLMNRAGMVIREIIDKNKLSNSRLSKIMGCGKNTINNYKNSKTMPSTTFIAKLADYYGVNVHWLHTGDGLPFYEDGSGPRKPLDETRAASAEHPLSGRGKTSFDEEETVVAPKGVYNPTKDLRVSSLAEKAARIIQSNTPYRDVLFRTIEVFDKALKTEKETMEMEAKIKQTTRRVESLQERLKGFEGEIVE